MWVCIQDLLRAEHIGRADVGMRKRQEVRVVPRIGAESPGEW